MSVATVVTLGFGTFGSVNLLPTLGFSIQAVPITSAPFYRPYSTETSEVLLSSTETLDVLPRATESVDYLPGGVDEQYQ